MKGVDGLVSQRKRKMSRNSNGRGMKDSAELQQYSLDRSHPPPLIDSRKEGSEWPISQRSYQYQYQSVEEQPPPGSGSTPEQPYQTPQAAVTDQPVQLADLLHMMQRQNAASQALEERRLKLEEDKMQLERERLANEKVREANQAAAAAQDKAARIKERELDRRLKEVPQLPRMTDEEMYLVGFEKRGCATFVPF